MTKSIGSTGKIDGESLTVNTDECANCRLERRQNDKKLSIIAGVVGIISLLIGISLGFIIGFVVELVIILNFFGIVMILWGLVIAGLATRKLSSQEKSR